MNINELIKNMRNLSTDFNHVYTEPEMQKAREAISSIHYRDNKEFPHNNPYWISITDLIADWMRAKSEYKERMLKFDLWKQWNWYKRMNKKRWEQWHQQNLK